jgi:SAM-dependent methyltransferase
VSAIRTQIEELGPWITGFDFRGERYGGDYIAKDDSRVAGFIAAFRRGLENTGDGKRRLRILECGCLEGGHTVLLAQAFPNAEIVATDLRETNLRKARFLASLHQLRNVRWIEENLANPQLVWREDYDAVFCVGLLYHLRDPAKFLSDVGKRTSFLWLWTVICAEAEVVVTERNHRGRMLAETLDHPLSGWERESFLPTLGSLTDMLWDAGFRSVHLLDKGLTANDNGPYILLQAERELTHTSAG